MLTISHSVDIDVPPKDVWTWLSELPNHYLDWHPAHRECRLIQGELWEPSAVLEVQEELHGRLHRLRFQVTSVSPGREVTYRTGRWFRGRFVIEPTDGHSRFTAELSFGLPGIGRILDRPLAHLFRHRIATAHQHQREEGLNLKRLLEAPGY